TRSEPVPEAQSMLLTITTTHRPANDLGYLLHKHPERFQSFDLNTAPRRSWPCLTERRTFMGASRDDFVKYPRTPHLFGSKGTDDDKHLGREESEAFIKDASLIVEEKLDGTNVGI